MDQMNARRCTRGLAAAAAILLAVAGCKPHADPTAVSRNDDLTEPPRAHAPQPAALPANEAAAAEPAVSPLPDALAQKTAAYARGLDATTAATPAPAGTAHRRTEPSPVQWDESGNRTSAHSKSA